MIIPEAPDSITHVHERLNLSRKAETNGYPQRVALKSNIPGSSVVTYHPTRAGGRGQEVDESLRIVSAWGNPSTAVP